MARFNASPLLMPRLFFMALVLSLLSACGYHLRGAVELPEGLSEVYIEGAEDDFDMRNSLARMLRLSGARVVEDQAAATGTLVLSSIQEQRQAVSFDINGDAARYRLELRAVFATRVGAEKTASATQVARANISYAYDAALPLQMEREEQRLFRQLRDQVAQSMLRLMAKRTPAVKSAAP